MNSEDMTNGQPNYKFYERMGYSTLERNRAIIKAVLSGRSHADVGQEYGITPCRVKQIVDRAKKRGEFHE